MATVSPGRVATATVVDNRNEVFWPNDNFSYSPLSLLQRCHASFFSCQLSKTSPNVESHFTCWTGACTVWRVAHAGSDFVVYFLGRLAAVLNVFHLWIIFLTVECWTLIVWKGFGNCFQTDVQHQLFISLPPGIALTQRLANVKKATCTEFCVPPKGQMLFLWGCRWLDDFYHMASWLSIVFGGALHLHF